MDTRRDGRAVRAAVGLVAAALLMVSSACASSSAGDGGAAARTDPAVPSSPASSAVALDADQAACQDVQNVFLRLAAVSSGWDPARDPFDARIAHALGPLILELRDQARSASTDSLRVVVDRNADALGALQAGMVSGRRPRVTVALAETRRAYAALPSCAHRDEQPSPEPSAATSPVAGGGATPAPGASATGPPRRFADDPGCTAARAAYAALGPVTSTWDVGAHPFDPSTARALRTAAAALLAASRDGKVRVLRAELRANGAAMQQLASAMASRSSSQVTSGVVAVQQTAVSLAATCPLG